MEITQVQNEKAKIWPGYGGLVWLLDGVLGSFEYLADFIQNLAILKKVWSKFELKSQNLQKYFN